MTPEEITKLHNSITKNDLKQYQPERYVYCIFCSICLFASIYFSVMFISKHDNYELPLFTGLGTAGIMGVSVYNLLKIMSRIHAHVIELVKQSTK